jgi:hopanoid biosynthesis associated RND transporter like protein HpnN
VISSGTERLGRAIAWWVDTVSQSALWVLIASGIVTGILLYYTANHLGINTNTTDMLSDSLHFRRLDEAFKAAFPQYDSTMIIVVDGETPDLAMDSSLELAKRLKEETGIFRTVYQPGDGKFFEEHALLYLSPTELDDLADHLSRVQPLFGKLAQDQSLRGLFSVLREGIQAVKDGEDIELKTVFDRLSIAVGAALNQKHFAFSWMEMMQGRDAGPDDRQRFILVQPRLDHSKLFPGREAMEAVRSAAGELNLDPEHGVRVRLTGEVALEYEELLSVCRGAGVAGLISLILVGIVLFAGLGSPRLVFCGVTTLIMGLIWTAGFAAFAVGHLNLISVAFAVLYIGLGVDYAIHFILRYRELRIQGAAHPGAIHLTAKEIGGSLVLCALTTAIGFYAFIPTAFTGVAELGIISGTGMFIGLVATLTVLPALLTLIPFPERGFLKRRRPSPLMGMLLTLPVRHSTAIRWGALLLGLVTLLLLPRMTFDRNTLNLGNPETESVLTFRELLSRSGTSPWTLNVIAPNAETAGQYSDRLNALEAVEKAIFIKDFVPPDQGRKIGSIEELGLILGPDLKWRARRNPLPPSSSIHALQGLVAELEGISNADLDTGLMRSARGLSGVLRQYEKTLLAQNKPLQEKMLKLLEENLLGSLPGRLRLLKASLAGGSVTMDDLPVDLVGHWVSDDGAFRVQVFPRDDLNNNKALRRFVSDVQEVSPDAIGLPVIILEAGDAVVRAFKQALFLALAAITILLLILMQRKSDAFLVLIPLILAGALTGATCVLIHLPFNFANVIALPLILGVGVDSGVHMVQRKRRSPSDHGNLLQTSTGRAVLFSGLTTICSFGNLAFSAHQGMASMGLLLSIGIGFTLLCTLIVLPALIRS